MQRNKQIIFEWGGGTRRSHILLALVITREIREGRPLLFVETEANGDSRSTYERGPSLVDRLHGLVVPLQEIFVLHWMLKSAQYKIYFFS
jgi:hypothetical protein